jgi:hypothetical protein
MKFLLVLLVVVVGLWLILKRGSKGGASKIDAAAPPTPKSSTPEGVSQMVACARCGVRFPQEEALRDVQERIFCSQAHLAAGPQ